MPSNTIQTFQKANFDEEKWYRFLDRLELHANFYQNCGISIILSPDGECLMISIGGTK